MGLQGKRLGVIHGQAQQLQRGGVGLQHLQAGVDHQHPVGEVVDHQAVDLLLGLGAQAVEQGLGALAPDTLGQLVREIGHAEIAGTGKSRLVIGLGAVVEPAVVLPEGVGQRQQRDAGRGAKGQHQSAQCRGDQDGNGQQRGVVERADLKDLQQKDRRNVDADHGQPLQGCARRRQMTSGSQAQHDGQRQIGEADQPGQGRADVLQLQIQRLQQHQGQRQKHAAAEEGLPQTHERGVEAGVRAPADGFIERDGGVLPGRGGVHHAVSDGQCLAGPGGGVPRCRRSCPSRR